MSKRGAAPARPYRRYPIRRLLFECNRRLHDARGPRAFEAMAALMLRSPEVKSGIVYIGDSCIDAGREHCCGSCRKAGRRQCDHRHCCMSRLMGDRCGKTAHRAKHDLQRVGLVKLHGAGPQVKAGGKMLDHEQRAVGAATGYELDPELFTAEPAARPARSTLSDDRHPAEARVRREGQAKLRDALERMRSRAGP